MKQSTVRARLKSMRKAPLLVMAMLLTLSKTWAASTTWTGAVSDHWSNAGNWTNGVPASNPASNFDVIMLGPGNTTNIADTFHYSLSSLQFPAGAPSFLIHVKNVTIVGPATNNSGLTQTLEVDPGHLQGAILVIGHDGVLGPIHIINDGGQTLGGGGPNEGGTTLFEAGTIGAAPNAGQATIDNNAAAVSPLNSDTAGVGSTEFFAGSAGNATINNHGGAVEGANGGFTHFSDNSTAGNATIHNIGATATNASAGTTFFRDSSTAGSATIINDGTSSTGFFTAGFTDFTGSSSAQNATIINDNGSAQVGRTQFDGNATADHATINNIGGTFTSPKGGFTAFLSDATAASATINNNGGTGAFAGGGETRFFGGSGGNATINNNAAADRVESGGRTIFETGTAANATINNNGATAAADSIFDPAGATIFQSNSSAGSATINNNGGGFNGSGGKTFFNATSTAGTATIVNNGGGILFGGGGQTTFAGSSTADASTLIANPGAPAISGGQFIVPGGNGGTILFNENSTGGTARVEVFGNGSVDISAHAAPGVTIGSLEGDGNAFLGAHNLSVGSNNQNTTFAGVAQDGGNNGGAGGSLTKVGSGTLTLSGNNTYTGATTVAAGKLLVDGSIASSASVTVNAGAILGGHGSVSSISGPGIVSPGNSPGILTATHVDPSAGTDFVFELTHVGSPTYNNAAASGNDVLHLTDPAPFTMSLTAANQITIDFSGASLAAGQLYRGGFFTNTPTDTSVVSNATFIYTGLNGFSAQFDGFVVEPTANFATGTVINGTVLEFEIEGTGNGGTGGTTTSAPDRAVTAVLLLISLATIVAITPVAHRRRSGIADQE